MCVSVFLRKEGSMCAEEREENGACECLLFVIR